jgi:alpha-galactosidase
VDWLRWRLAIVRHAAMLDPNAAATLTLEQIEELCDELTRPHRDVLPAALRSTTERVKLEVA